MHLWVSLMLSPKRKKFVAHMATSGNATEAAILAGYSRRSASTEGHRLLRNAEVRAALAEARTKTLVGIEVTGGRILAELAAIAFAPTAELPKLAHKLKALDVLARLRMNEELERRLSELEDKLARLRPALAYGNGHVAPSLSR